MPQQEAQKITTDAPQSWAALLDRLMDLLGEMRAQGLRELLFDEDGNLEAKRVEVVTTTRRVG